MNAFAAPRQCAAAVESCTSTCEELPADGCKRPRVWSDWPFSPTLRAQKFYISDHADQCYGISSHTGLHIAGITALICGKRRSEDVSAASAPTLRSLQSLPVNRSAVSTVIKTITPAIKPSVHSTALSKSNKFRACDGDDDEDSSSATRANAVPAYSKLLSLFMSDGGRQRSFSQQSSLQQQQRQPSMWRSSQGKCRDGHAETTPPVIASRFGNVRALRMMTLWYPCCRAAVTTLNISHAATLPTIPAAHTHGLLVPAPGEASAGVKQRDLAWLELPRLQLLNVSFCSAIHDLRTLLSAGSSCTSLTNLNLQRSGVTQEGISGLEAPFLKILNLDSCQVTNISTLLGSTKELLSLNLSSSCVTQSGLKGVQLPQLRALSLHGCGGIYDLKSILQGSRSSITELDLSFSGVTQLGLAGFEAPHLRTLDISGCMKITNLVTLLGRCRELQALCMKGSGVMQTGITGLVAPALHSVNVEGCRGITDVSALLRFSRQLEYFRASDSGITQSGIGKLTFSTLISLSLGRCRGIWDITTLLKGCRSLKRLDLSGSSVLQSGIAGVEAPLLEWVSLAGCRGITDVSVLFRGCALLRHLDLTGSGVVNAEQVKAVHPNANEFWSCCDI